MEDDDTRDGFKIFGENDDASADSGEEIILLHEGLAVSDDGAAPAGKAKKEKKRGIRKTLVFFTLLVLFALFGGALYAAFAHVNERLNQIEASGFHEMTDLSQEIEERLDVFSSRLESEHEQMHSEIADIAGRMEKNARTISELDNRIQAIDRGIAENIGEEIAAMESKLAEQGRQIDNVENKTIDRMEALEQRMESLSPAISAASETAGVLGEIKNDMDALETRIDRVSESVAAAVEGIDAAAAGDAGREALAAAAETRRELEHRIDALDDRMERNRIAMQDEIAALKAMMHSLRALTLDPEGRTGIIEEELE